MDEQTAALAKAWDDGWESGNSSGSWGHTHKPRNPHSGEMNDDVNDYCPEHGGIALPENCDDESHPPPPPLPPCTCPVREAVAVVIEDRDGIIASGGWSAPSETLYSLLNDHEESCPHHVPPLRLSMPEVSVDRGAIKFTTGIEM
jgi:hypothetical protein